jgi:hypothetical protein
MHARPLRAHTGYYSTTYYLLLYLLPTSTTCTTYVRTVGMGSGCVRVLERRRVLMCHERVCSVCLLRRARVPGLSRALTLLEVEL